MSTLVRDDGGMPKIVDHDERRRELGVALLRVLARDGIEAVSVRTVAAEAGWTRGVIAHYFSDRDELLLYAYRLALQREFDNAMSLESGGGPVDRVVALVLRALPIDDESSLDFRIFLGLLGRIADRPELAASLAEDHALYERRLLDAVDAAIRAGGITTSLPAHVVADILSVFVDGLTVRCAIDPATADRGALDGRIRTFLQSLGG